MKFTLHLLSGALLLSAFLVQGCGKSDSDDSATPAPSASKPATPAPTATTGETTPPATGATTGK